ncbi:MAG: hypothetical protein GX855_04685 [Firmicutes bacterium]|nr:hypothetical protein [Bacillota bacterium]
MNGRKWIIVWLLLVFLFGVCPANAQVLDRAEIQVIVTIPQMLLVRVNTSELVFTEEDFDTTKDAVMLEEGILASKTDAVQIEVAGNVPHALYISAADEAFQGPNGTSLPSSQMGFRLIGSAGESPWHTLRTRDATGEPVFSSQTAGRNILRMDVQLLATWMDTPGTYRGTIVYTVVPLTG